MTIFLFLELLYKLLLNKISEPTNDALVRVSCLIDKMKRMENQIAQARTSDQMMAQMAEKDEQIAKMKEKMQQQQ